MLKQKIIRFLCLFLSLLMVILALAACSDTDQDKNVETTQSNASNTEGKDTSSIYQPDTVPDDLDYNNRVITMLYWSDREHEEFESDGTNADPVNDAIFYRNIAVEERLGVEMQFTSTVGDTKNIEAWTTYVKNGVSSGSNPFNIMAGYSQSVAATANQGLCFDLLDPDCKYLNFDMPWWPDRLISEATINNKLYFCSGDISANALYMMYGCFVNTDIAAELNLPDIFTLVDNNQWTYDKFIEMCQNSYHDKNGDSVKSVGDQFGYMVSKLHTDPWFYGSGALIVDKDDAGIPRMSPSLSGEPVIKSIEILNNLLWNTNDGVFVSEADFTQSEFNNGNILFSTDRVRISITTYVSENLHYAVVPFPKYDTNQENFATVLGNPFSLYSIPIDANLDDISMLSAFIETYASESYRQVTPVLYEITLKTKYVQEANSARMYDIIRENLVFDIGRIFANVLIGQKNFRDAIAGNSNNWSSLIRNLEKNLSAKLEKLINAYEG